MSDEEQLYDLLKRMWERGKIVTVSQVALPPLRMGHYYTRVEVRPKRDTVEPAYQIFVMDCENP